VNAAFEDAPLLYALSHVAEMCAVTVAVDEDGTLVFRADVPSATSSLLLVSSAGGMAHAPLPDHVIVPDAGEPVYHRRSIAAVRAALRARRRKQANGE
jgi:hypothetical protein